jgi:hypothetical protein
VLLVWLIDFLVLALRLTVVLRGLRVFITLVALSFLLPLAALRLPAQSLAGNLGGTIHDPRGTGARNATVIMPSHKSNTIVMTASDGDGNFRFTSLPAGEYEMKVVQRGFEVYRAPQVVLEPGRESSQRGSRWNSPQSWRKWTSCRKGPPRLCQDRKPGENRRGRSRWRSTGRKTSHHGHASLSRRCQAGIEGSKPLSLRVMNSQADPELARAAVESVSQWRYRPTLLNGEPIEVDTTIMVNFSLLP